MKTHIRIALWAAVASLALAGCVKEIRPPVVEIDLDQSIYDSGEGTATLVGHVTDDGGELNGVGFCYTTGSLDPTIYNNRHSGGTRADFTVKLTGLAKGNYRVRAYATNSVGTSYSAPASLEITGYSVPTVSLGTCTANASNKSASLKGAVTANGGKPITEAGFCYMKSSAGTGTPTISNNKVTSSNLTNLSATLNNLSDGTYRVRAYATNSLGTGYSTGIATFTIGDTPSAGEGSIVITFGGEKQDLGYVSAYLNSESGWYYVDAAKGYENDNYVLPLFYLAYAIGTDANGQEVFAPGDFFNNGVPTEVYWTTGYSVSGNNRGDYQCASIHGWDGTGFDANANTYTCNLTYKMYECGEFLTYAQNKIQNEGIDVNSLSDDEYNALMNDCLAHATQKDLNVVMNKLPFTNANAVAHPRSSSPKKSVAIPTVSASTHTADNATAIHLDASRRLYAK